MSGRRFRRRSAVGICLAGLLLSNSPGSLNAEKKKLAAADYAALRRVDGHYNHLHSLRTEFTESYDGMGLHRVETGTLLLSKPGRMRWTYSEPRGKLFVLDSRYAYSYSPGDAQAQRIPAKQMDDLRSPLRLLLGRTQLSHELTDVTVTQKPDGRATITGRPSATQANLRTLELQVDAAGQILSLRLVDAGGSATSFDFRNTTDDVPVSSLDFAFSPPAGVPIVDGLAPI